MSDSIIVGCDQHSDTLNVCIGVGRQEPRRRVFSNNPKGRMELIEALLKLADRCGARRGDVHLAYEASRLGFGLYDQLRDVGFECSVLATTRIARSPQAQVCKTDPKDALRIFELVRGAVLAGNELPAVWAPDRQLRQEREVVRARSDVVSKITRVKNQISGLLARFEIEKPTHAGRGWTGARVAWLEWLADGTAPGLGAGARTSLARLLEELAFYRGQLRQVEEQITELAGRERYAQSVERITAIKGVGVMTAMVFLSEVGEMGRFTSRRQVGAYLGLAPASYESGQADERKGHITGQGPGRVRQALCQAAWVWIRWDKRARRMYEQHMKSNGRQAKKALVALMRKLGILMWHAAREGLHRWAA